MAIRFPRRAPDGSFCIEVALRIEESEPAILIDQLNSWLHEWISENHEWATALIGIGGKSDFFDHFASIPTCSIAPSGSLILRMHGRAETKKEWKDWLVIRLLPAIKQRFQQMSLESVRNCASVIAVGKSPYRK